MAVTMADIKEAVRARGHGADSDEAQTQFIRAALRKLGGAYRWPFLVTRHANYWVAAGENFVTEPLLGNNLVAHIESVIVADEDPEALPFMDLHEFEALPTDVTGRPECWSRRVNTIVLWPTADQHYDLALVAPTRQPIPDADADEISWPDVYIDVIVESVCADLAYRQRDYQAHAVAQARYMQLLSDMIGEYTIRQRGTSDQVQTWDGWDELT